MDTSGWRGSDSMNHTNATRMVAKIENTNHAMTRFLITRMSRATWVRSMPDANSGDAPASLGEEFPNLRKQLSQRTAESSDILLHELHTCMLFGLRFRPASIRIRGHLFAVGAFAPHERGMRH